MGLRCNVEGTEWWGDFTPRQLAAVQERARVVRIFSEGVQRALAGDESPELAQVHELYKAYHAGEPVRASAIDVRGYRPVLVLVTHRCGNDSEQVQAVAFRRQDDDGNVHWAEYDPTDAHCRGRVLMDVATYAACILRGNGALGDDSAEIVGPSVDIHGRLRGLFILHVDRPDTSPVTDQPGCELVGDSV